MSAAKVTQPILNEPSDRQAHITVAATWKDPQTKALYVHSDLVRVQNAYAEEAHVAPMSAKETFGDVESFVRYVHLYGRAPTAHLTWNSAGLRAILDYADAENGDPGRCQWAALLPFRRSLQWEAWLSFANGQSLGQKSAVEKLEDLASDIVEPAPADLMGLLRGLRATVNAKADTELRPDGTTKVAFERDAKVQSASSLELPSSFAIAIPVLKGHVAEGRPVVYRLDVRLRVSVDDGAKLLLRFTIPNAERVLEDVYAERVATAKGLLAANYELLRAAD